MVVRCRSCGQHISLVEAADNFLARQCLLWAHQLTCTAQPLIPVLVDWLDPVQRAKYSWTSRTHMGKYFSYKLQAYSGDLSIGQIEIYRDFESGVTDPWNVIPIIGTPRQRERVRAYGLPYTGTGNFAKITEIVRSAVEVFSVDQTSAQS